MSRTRNDEYTTVADSGEFRGRTNGMNGVASLLADQILWLTSLR